MPVRLSDIVDSVIAIGHRAGAEILKIYESDFGYETKADDSPLTAADRASHELICSELQKLTPDIPIWSEESATVAFAERSGWSEFWLVDPLDGTKEFIKRNGEFTVNIAMIRGNEPVLGVVQVPVSGRCYFGYQGAGAFLAESDGSRHPIAVTTAAQTPIRVVGSRSHASASLQTYLDRIGQHVMVPMGSSLKLCLVAGGEADIYPRLGPTSEWDTAAAQAVVEAAGGKVVDLQGKRLLYNTKAEVLNPHFLVFGDDSRPWARAAASLPGPAPAGNG